MKMVWGRRIWTWSVGAQITIEFSQLRIEVVVVFVVVCTCLLVWRQGARKVALRNLPTTLSRNYQYDGWTLLTCQRRLALVSQNRYKLHNDRAMHSERTYMFMVGIKDTCDSDIGTTAGCMMIKCVALRSPTMLRTHHFIDARGLTRVYVSYFKVHDKMRKAYLKKILGGSLSKNWFCQLRVWGYG